MVTTSHAQFFFFELLFLLEFITVRLLHIDRGCVSTLVIKDFNSFLKVISHLSTHFELAYSVKTF